MATNSLVGITLLLALLAVRSGTSGFTELTAAFGWRSLVPGLLSTFFVFASLIGYQRLGAGTTISVLVTSQLIGGLVADAIKTGGARSMQRRWSAR
jgi:transporter family-2 protein